MSHIVNVALTGSHPAGTQIIGVVTSRTKPERVAVGQRWRHLVGEEHRVVAIGKDDEGDEFSISYENGRRFRVWSKFLLREGSLWEYLGMVGDPPPSPPPTDLQAALEALASSPPSWAYPLGWKLAILWAAEPETPMGRAQGALLGHFAPDGLLYKGLRTYAERRLAGDRHDEAKMGIGVERMCDVDVRGMDVRAKPLLVRPRGTGRVR